MREVFTSGPAFGETRRAVTGIRVRAYPATLPMTIKITPVAIG